MAFGHHTTNHAPSFNSQRQKWKINFWSIRISGPTYWLSEKTYSGMEKENIQINNGRFGTFGRWCALGPRIRPRTLEYISKWVLSRKDNCASCGWYFTLRVHNQAKKMFFFPLFGMTFNPNSVIPRFLGHSEFSFSWPGDLAF